MRNITVAVPDDVDRGTRIRACGFVETNVLLSVISADPDERHKASQA